MSEARKIPFNNPGWAGNTGEYGHLTEEQVRGKDFVGERPPEGGHPSGCSTYSYMLAERDPEAPIFDGPYKERLEKIRTRYPDARSALLPCLGMAQEIRGHLSAETMDEVAAVLDLSPAYVRGVATFYTMYNKRPVGRFLIQVCTGISCNLKGGEEVAQAFLNNIGCELGETSEDGLFTVTEVECLAGCGFPTTVQINSEYYENVSPKDVPEILERLKAEGK